MIRISLRQGRTEREQECCNLFEQDLHHNYLVNNVPQELRSLVNELLHMRSITLADKGRADHLLWYLKHEYGKRKIRYGRKEKPWRPYQYRQVA